jgi:hypothetical protein
MKAAYPDIAYHIGRRHIRPPSTTDRAEEGEYVQECGKKIPFAMYQRRRGHPFE